MPEATDVHVDAALSEFAMRYTNPTGVFVADIVAPRVPVTKQSDKYYEWDKNNLRLVETLRHEKDEPREVDYKLSTSSYFCEDHELKHLISDEERSNADPAINPEEDAVQFLLDIMALDRENRIKAILTDQTKITQGTALSGTNQWNDLDSSNPFGDIAAGKAAVLAGCLRKANIIVIPHAVGQQLKQHEDYIERIKYTGQQVTPGGLLPEIDGLRVIEADVQYNTAQEGQTDTFAEMWGKNVVIGYVPPGRPTKQLPGGLVTFEWNPRQVRRWRDEGKKSDVIAASDGYTADVLTGTAFFYLIRTVIA